MWFCVCCVERWKRWTGEVLGVGTHITMLRGGHFGWFTKEFYRIVDPMHVQISSEKPLPKILTKLLKLFHSRLLAMCVQSKPTLLKPLGEIAEKIHSKTKNELPIPTSSQGTNLLLSPSKVCGEEQIRKSFQLGAWEAGGVKVEKGKNAGMVTKQFQIQYVFTPKLTFI